MGGALARSRDALVGLTRGEAGADRCRDPPTAGRPRSRSPSVLDAPGQSGPQRLRTRSSPRPSGWWDFIGLRRVAGRAEGHQLAGSGPSGASGDARRLRRRVDHCPSHRGPSGIRQVRAGPGHQVRTQSSRPPQRSRAGRRSQCPTPTPPRPISTRAIEAASKARSARGGGGTVVFCRVVLRQGPREAGVRGSVPGARHGTGAARWGRPKGGYR